LQFIAAREEVEDIDRARDVITDDEEAAGCMCSLCVRLRLRLRSSTVTGSTSSANDADNTDRVRDAKMDDEKAAGCMCSSCVCLCSRPGTWSTSADDVDNTDRARDAIMDDEEGWLWVSGSLQVHFCLCLRQAPVTGSAASPQTEAHRRVMAGSKPK
jgi:hypothetical protein